MMNPQQKKRYDKINTERFFWLAASIDDQQYTLDISGSTSNVYTVTIHRNRKRIQCNCPDSTNWARRYGCVCKHCCFVLCRVLRVVTRGSEFWNTRLFDNETMTRIDHAVERLLKYGSEFTSEELTKRYQNIISKLKNSAFEDVDKSRISDDCPICFDTFDESDLSKIVACPICKNVIHTECMKRWIQSGSNKSCVYCRSDIWQQWGKQQTHDYVCLE